MWTNIRQWFSKNELPLTWFIIGVFSTWAVVDFERANYLGALFDLIIVAVNYIYRPR